MHIQTRRARTDCLPLSRLYLLSLTIWAERTLEIMEGVWTMSAVCPGGSWLHGVLHQREKPSVKNGLTVIS